MPQLPDDISPATRRAYENDWQVMMTWAGHRRLPFTRELIVCYIDEHAPKLAIATITRRLSALRAVYRTSGSQDVTAHLNVKQALARARRNHGRPQAVKHAITLHELTQMIETRPGTIRGIRDAALLAVGWVAALRPEEIAGAKGGDLVATGSMYVLKIARSKTDQVGEGHVVGIPSGENGICPVKLLDAWLVESKTREGPVFRSIGRLGDIGTGISTKTVSAIVKAAAADIGLDPRTIGGHSLRAGLCTAAAAAGASEAVIMKVSRHRSRTTVHRYIRRSAPFSVHAATIAGL